MTNVISQLTQEPSGSVAELPFQQQVALERFGPDDQLTQSASSAPVNSPANPQISLASCPPENEAATSSNSVPPIKTVAELESRPTLTPPVAVPIRRRSRNRLAFFWNQYRWPIRGVLAVGCLFAGFFAWEHSPAAKKRRAAAHEVPFVLDDVRNHAPTRPTAEPRHFGSLSDPFASFANDGNAPKLTKPATQQTKQPALTVPPLFLAGNSVDGQQQTAASEGTVPLAKVPRGAWLTGTIEVTEDPGNHGRTIDQTADHSGPRLFQRN